jgi:hypothetical protein
MLLIVKLGNCRRIQVKKYCLLLLIVICLLISSTLRADVENQLVTKRFTEYLNHLKAGEFDQASSFWMPDYISSVYKFGVFYTDIPYKYDCNSNYIHNLEGIRNGSVKVDFTIVPKGIKDYRAALTLTDSLGESKYYYFISRGEDANYYLIPQYWNTMQSMIMKEQKYVRVYYFKERQVNKYALELLDTKIEEIAGQLGLDGKALNRLAEDKMTYILTENLNQVQEFTGFPCAGWHDQSNNFIISSDLPHCKMVTEFLVDYKLGELPLHTLPFMKEGLAVHLGGRAGTRLNVFGQLVEFSLKAEYFKLEDILTSSDFNEKLGGMDFSYTLSGYFVGYLHELMGMENLLALYVDLSSDQKKLEQMSTMQLKKVIEIASGKKWIDLENRFLAYLKPKINTEVETVNVKAEGDIVYQSGSPKYSVTIYEHNDYYILDASSFNKDTPVSATLIFNYSPARFDSEYQSSLFATQFPEIEYQRQFYGIAFNQDEVGIYNYLTNEITAKYISSFAAEQISAAKGSVTIRFKKQQMPDDFSKYNIQVIEIPY